MKKTIFSVFLSLFLYHGYSQIITTVAGGANTSLGDGGFAVNAGLDGPIDVALDDSGNFYIADAYNNRIRKVNAAGIITTIAGNDTTTFNGDGIPATAAHLLRPAGIIYDHGSIYFADAFHNRIRKIDTNGIITTIAGNGTGGYTGDNVLADTTELYDPHCIVLDNSGNLYITDWGNHRIRKVSSTGVIMTVAGTGVAGYTGDSGPATAAEINAPYGISIDNIGNLYFADAYANVVRKIDLSGIITTFAGGGIVLGDGGPATSAELVGPAGLAINGNNIYIADSHNQRVRIVDAPSGIITTIAGDGTMGYSGDNGSATAGELSEPSGLAIDADGNLYIADFNSNHIRRVGWPLNVDKLTPYIYGITLYPNPTSGIFTIDIIENITEQAQIIITNESGEKVKDLNVLTNTSLPIMLDQPPGIYYLSAIISHGIVNKIISIINR